MTPKAEKLVWTQKKRKLRQRFVFLTEKDMNFEEGEKDQMFNMLERRLGKTKEQLHEIMALL